MFQISEEMARYWEKKAKPKASNEDVGNLEKRFGVLPAPYAEFIESFGYVVFSMDLPSSFDFEILEGRQRVLRRATVSSLMRADRVLQAHKILTADDPEDNLPKFPSEFMPIGNDPGQGHILLRFGPSGGQVFYWPWRDERWGSPGNEGIGHVAEDFYAFINGLKPFDAA